MSLSHLTDYLERNAGQYAQKPAIIFESQTVGWQELWQRVLAQSGRLSQKLHNDHQEVAAILLPNSVEFIVNYLAILHCGHIALPLDPAYKPLELEAILKQIPSKLLITSREYTDKVGRGSRAVVMADEVADGPAPAKERLLRLPAECQIASLTFTSGTTAQPKAVPNTHANHIWNIEVCSEVWDWTHQDNLLLAVPLSHMLGIVMGLSGALYHGNTLYLHRWFDPAATLEALASGEISFFSHAASAYIKLLQAPDNGYDLSKVRLCVSGAAPLPPAIWDEFKARYDIEIVETYGTTETGRIAANRLDERRQGSPGKPLPGVDLNLSAEGEVEIKSKGVFPGYFNNPQATKAALTADGYWRTGDIAELRDGYVYLKGRKQERIRRFGYTVSPRDVEWAMLKLPKIEDIYVMGVQSPTEPDDKLIYFIVGSASDEHIMDYCKQNLLFAWRPDKIIRLDDIPRTKSGKAHLGSLRQLAGSV